MTVRLYEASSGEVIEVECWRIISFITHWEIYKCGKDTPTKFSNKKYSLCEVNVM